MFFFYITMQLLNIVSSINKFGSLRSLEVLFSYNLLFIFIFIYVSTI